LSCRIWFNFFSFSYLCLQLWWMMGIFNVHCLSSLFELKMIQLCLLRLTTLVGLSSSCYFSSSLSVLLSCLLTTLFVVVILRSKRSIRILLLFWMDWKDDRCWVFVFSIHLPIHLSTFWSCRYLMSIIGSLRREY
jgi:hypothetical protein